MKQTTNWNHFDFIIGIDPGTKTGFAVWDRQRKVFTTVTSTMIHEAFDLLTRMTPGSFFVRMEDARLRTWFGNSGKEKLQGAGSIKRDCAIWEDYLKANHIPFELVAPKSNKTKVTAEYFKKVTGWEWQTNEHGRDAALLIFNL